LKYLFFGILVCFADEIKYLYNQKAIAIDLEHQLNTANGKMYALWYENGDFYVIDNKGTKANLK